MGFCHDDDPRFDKKLEKDEHAGLRLWTGAELFFAAGIVLLLVHIAARFI